MKVTTLSVTLGKVTLALQDGWPGLWGKMTNSLQVSTPGNCLLQRKKISQWIYLADSSVILSELCWYCSPPVRHSEDTTAFLHPYRGTISRPVGLSLGFVAEHLGIWERMQGPGSLKQDRVWLSVSDDREMHPTWSMFETPELNK